MRSSLFPDKELSFAHGTSSHKLRALVQKLLHLTRAGFDLQGYGDISYTPKFHSKLLTWSPEVPQGTAPSFGCFRCSRDPRNNAALGGHPVWLHTARKGATFPPVSKALTPDLHFSSSHKIQNIYDEAIDVPQ